MITIDGKEVSATRWTHLNLSDFCIFWQIYASYIQEEQVDESLKH